MMMVNMKNINHDKSKIDKNKYKKLLDKIEQEPNQTKAYGR